VFLAYQLRFWLAKKKSKKLVILEKMKNLLGCAWTAGSFGVELVEIENKKIPCHLGRAFFRD
jgi:hypothetical protein